MTTGGAMAPFSSAASPEGWSWSLLDAGRPRRAIDHMAHSELTPVIVDPLGPADAPADSSWALTREIPVILVDSLDAYWAFERVLNKLNSFGKTPEEAKADLVSKLGGHLQLLSSLESPKMAPVLRLELEFLRAVMRPVELTDPS